MITEQKDFSLAIFGSYARGDFDKRSDKDLLCVSRKDEDISETIKYYKNKQWSITELTWKSFRKRAKGGDLFIKHIKEEGVIVFDDQYKLQGLLKEYKPPSNFSTRYEKSLSLLLLLEHIPENPIGRLWACDVLFVISRSISISHLANKGCFVFGTDDIVDSLKHYYDIDIEMTFKKLRRLKCLYRNKQYDKSPSWELLYGFLRDIDQAFSIDFRASTSNLSQIVNALMSGLEELDWYYQSRLIDILLKLLNRRRPEQSIDPNLKRIKRISEDPRKYRGFLSGNSSKLRTELSAVIK